MINKKFRLQYEFKIQKYTSDISIISAKFGPMASYKRAFVSLVLPTKIGIDKMKEIVKMRCEKMLYLSCEQVEFIKQREIKNIDMSIFENNSEEHFNNLFKSALERSKERNRLKPYQKYKKEYEVLTSHGMSPEGAKKLLSESASGRDVLEMNNSIYCESINGTPKLIEKLVLAGAGNMAYHIALSVKCEAEKEKAEQDNNMDIKD